MISRTDIQLEIEQNGFGIRENILSATQVKSLLTDLDRIDQTAAVLKRNGVLSPQFARRFCSREWFGKFTGYPRVGCTNPRQ